MAFESMGELKHEVEFENVCPSEAAEYLDGTFERNRPIVKDAVVHYASQMTNGTFLTATPLIFAFVRDENRMVLVDGQHRLSAVIQSGLRMRFTLFTYYLSTASQLAKLYATIDIGRTRNLSDNVRAHGLPEILGLAHTEAKKLASAVSLAVRKQNAFKKATSRHNESYADMIERTKDWRREGRWYFDLIKQTPKAFRLIGQRQAVIACALITIRGNKTKAEDFWAGVFLLDNIPSTDIRHKLHDKLQDLCNQSERGHSKAHYMNSHGVATLICSAWNTYLTGKSVQAIRPVKKIVFNRCHWREEK